MLRLLLLLCLAVTSSLVANDTSLHDGRFGPEPLGNEESPVRMVAEQIKVGFGYRFSEVHCTFTFRNTLADRPVEQLVGFPDIGAAADEVGRREPERASAVHEMTNTASLAKLRTLVDGQPVPSELRFGEVNSGEDHDGTAVWLKDSTKGVRAWHTLRVSFPAGKDVVIERLYRVQNGAGALGVAFFHYTTATGGVWNGTIGRLQVDVTLGDDLKVEQLIWPGATVLGRKLEGKYAIFATTPARDEWQVIDPKTLRLVWTDFEPRTDTDRRGFSLSRPFRGWKSDD